MNFTKTMFALAIGSVGIVGSMGASAATLHNGDMLSIVTGTTTSSGAATAGTTSWFALDFDGNPAIHQAEKTPLQQGTTGIVIGVATTPGASHPGFPDASDTNAITAPWSILGNTGSDYTTVGITAIGGDTANGLDMSGWKFYWTGNQVDLGTGAWQVPNAPTSGYTNGIGIFNWSGVYGESYTLDYTATPQSGVFAGVRYALHLEGVVAVPEASTYSMMLAGLGLVGVAARRRKQSKV